MAVEGVFIKTGEGCDAESDILPAFKQELDFDGEAAVKLESDIMLDADDHEEYSDDSPPDVGPHKLQEDTAQLTVEKWPIVYPEEMSIKSERGLADEGTVSAEDLGRPVSAEIKTEVTHEDCCVGFGQHFPKEDAIPSSFVEKSVILLERTNVKVKEDLNNFATNSEPEVCMPVKLGKENQGESSRKRKTEDCRVDFGRHFSKEDAIPSSFVEKSPVILLEQTNVKLKEDLDNFTTNSEPDVCMPVKLGKENQGENSRKRKTKGKMTEANKKQADCAGSSDLTKRFVCKICSARFAHLSTRNDHILIHSDERPFSCATCSARFKRKSYLPTHLLTHSDERPFACSLCAKRFKAKSALKRHALSHSLEKPSTCTHCFARFKSKQHLNQHMKSHSSEKPFKCVTCSACFRDRHALKDHSISHSEERPFHCAVCAKRFKSSYEMRRHAMRHSDERRFSCAHCSMQFKMKMDLLKHLKSHSDERPFVCLECSARFKSKRCLKLHLLLHSGKKRFSCHICFTRFAKKWNLKNHVLSHSDKRYQNRFACNRCPLKFITATSLKRHLDTHLPLADEPFNEEQFCDLCSAGFKTETSLKQHVCTPFDHSSCTDELKLESDSNSQSLVELILLLCDVCGVQYRTTSDLMPTFDRSSCTIDLKFESDSNLEPLVEPIPFLCNLCGSQYTTASDLTQHLVTHE